MILVLLLVRKVTRVILVIKEPKVIKVNQVMMEHQAQTVLKAILEKLARLAIRDYQAQTVLRAIKVNQVNRDKQATTGLRASRVNKVFLVKVFPQAGPLDRYWPNYPAMTMTQDGLINLVILTD
jgi:hypothetical protein